MKILVVSLLSGLVSVGMLAQNTDVKIADKPAEQQSIVEASKEAAKKMEEKRRADAQLLKNPITYSGFAVDLAKSDSKKKLLNLRQPNDPKTDLRYVMFEPRNRPGPKGFILFSLDF